jgi:hypothetical protein
MNKTQIVDSDNRGAIPSSPVHPLFHVSQGNERACGVVSLSLGVHLTAWEADPILLPRRGTARPANLRAPAELSARFRAQRPAPHAPCSDPRGAIAEVALRGCMICSAQSPVRDPQVGNLQVLKKHCRCSSTTSIKMRPAADFAARLGGLCFSLSLDLFAGCW